MRHNHIHLKESIAMWNTPEGARTLEGPEAKLVCKMLEYLEETLKELPEEPVLTRIPKFNALTANQQAALLAEVGEALLCRDVPCPMPTDINESAIAAIYDHILTHIALEIGGCRTGVSSTMWRQWTLNACKDLEDLPDVNCDKLSEWGFLPECLLAGILWDMDYLNDETADMSPDRSAAFKSIFGIHEGYFNGIAPDPRDEDMPIVYARLRALADMRRR